MLASGHDGPGSVANKSGPPARSAWNAAALRLTVATTHHCRGDALAPEKTCDGLRAAPQIQYRIEASSCAKQEAGAAE